MRTLFFPLFMFLAFACAAQPISLVKDLDPTPDLGTNIYEFKEANGTLFFSAASGQLSSGAIQKTQLWKTNGDFSSTSLLKSFDTSSGIYREIKSLTAFDNRLFFVANDGDHGYELWVSDGTAAGTHIFMDIWDGPDGGLDIAPGQNIRANTLKVMNGRLYFIARDGAHGFELWQTDGTVAGTSVVKPIDNTTGAGAIFVNTRTPIETTGSNLFFSASNDVGDTLLWKSDGTSAGTMEIAAVVPNNETPMLSYNG
jgi:ELWxxDGT repeat protein